MPNWVDVIVENADQHEALRTFLSAVFGWTWQLGSADTGFYAVAQHDGSPVLGLGQGEGGSGEWTTYFCSEDIDHDVARATELGASVGFGPWKVMDAGSMAILSDPVGARFGLWQADQFSGFGVGYEPGAPGWFDHASSDPATALAFYREFTQQSVVDAGPDMNVLAHGDQWFASLSPSPRGGEATWNAIFVVDTLERVHAVVPEHGGTIIEKEMPVPGSAICVFTDPVFHSAVTVMRAGNHPE